MATGITESAVTLINNALDDYRKELYNSNDLRPMYSTLEFQKAIKGTDTEARFKEAINEVERLTDRYTANMRDKLKELISNVDKNYKSQDSNSSTFTNLKNKYKS